MALSPEERARYQRHLSLEEVGVAGQERLKAARVLVIGAGGLGSPSALYLAASGIGTLGIVDCDRVEVSNLQRQVLFDSDHVARPKAEVARERLLALNPSIEVVAHDLELRAANVREVLAGYDVILDGTDRLATRCLVNDACVLLGKPLVSAAIHRFEGQVMTFVPGRGPCYRCLYADVPEGLVPSCADAGVLGPALRVRSTWKAGCSPGRHRHRRCVPSSLPSPRSNVPSGRWPALRAVSSTRQSENPSAGRDRNCSSAWLTTSASWMDSCS